MLGLLGLLGGRVPGAVATIVGDGEGVWDVVGSLVAVPVAVGVAVAMGVPVSVAVLVDVAVWVGTTSLCSCLLYTSDAADE